MLLGDAPRMIPRKDRYLHALPGSIFAVLFLLFFSGTLLNEFLSVGERQTVPDEFMPALTGRVVDDADILDAATISQLERLSAQLEAKTQAQFVVVTVPDLQGVPIEDFGYQLGRKWGIGRKDIDDGVLLIVAPNDREARIEVGYGLEGTLTDAASSVIMNNAILPAFRDGDMQRGVLEGAKAIVALAETSPTAEPLPGGIPEESDGQGPPVTMPFILFFVFMALIAAFPLWNLGCLAYCFINPAWGAHMVPAPRRGSGSGWGGGSGGSGGGGGFSGRGGSFGGGGSSGRW